MHQPSGNRRSPHKIVVAHILILTELEKLGAERLAECTSLGGTHDPVARAVNRETRLSKRRIEHLCMEPDRLQKLSLQLLTFRYRAIE